MPPVQARIRTLGIDGQSHKLAAQIGDQASDPPPDALINRIGRTVDDEREIVAATAQNAHEERDPPKRLPDARALLIYEADRPIDAVDFQRIIRKNPGEPRIALLYQFRLDLRTGARRRLL